MRRLLIVAALLTSTAAFAQGTGPNGPSGTGGGAVPIGPNGPSGGSGGPAPAPLPTTAKDAPISDYNKGWCRGWATAAKASAEAYTQWLKFLTVVNPKIKDDKSPLAEAARNIMESVPRFVLMPPQPGKVTLADGVVIDCLGVSEK